MEDENESTTDNQVDEQAEEEEYIIGEHGNEGKRFEKEKRKHFGSFKTMGLSTEVYKGIRKIGYNTPTPIQRKTIPVILSNQDVVAMARTGSGKTAAFLIPMLEKLKCHSTTVGVRAVVLSPTRELAMQTRHFFERLGKFTDLRSCLLLGGDSMDNQFADLAANPDVIIATPGRLMHHIVEVDLSLKTVEYIVFDEADRLLEMGFHDQLKEIISRLPESRQTLLFSATLPEQLIQFAKIGLNNPQLIRLDTDTKISDTLKLGFFTCRVEEKTAALLYLLKYIVNPDQLTVIFAATRHHVEFLDQLLLQYGYSCSFIYGTMDQTARKINLGKFRSGKSKILIVTDVAARGIDVPMLDNVINYDFPPTVKLFVHRVGRAGRMGRTGTAYSLVAIDELPYMIDIHLFLGKALLNAVPQGMTFSESDVYYGRLHQEALDSENEAIKDMMRTNIELEALHRSTLNAYKLYHKTRAKPSGESVHRAKELPNLNIHPLILQHANETEKQRNNFIQSIKRFRPSQTVFEMGTTPSKSVPALVMAVKRKMHNEVIDKKYSTAAIKSLPAPPEEVEESFTLPLSKREREQDEHSFSSMQDAKKQKTFKDEQFYMNLLPENHLMEKAYSVQGSNEGLNAGDIAFEVGADDADSIRKEEKVRKWDRKKKKFVFAKAGVDVNNSKQRQLIKNESGQIVKAENRGKIYKNWKDKNKLQIPKVGETENATMVQQFQNNQARWSHRHRSPQETNPHVATGKSFGLKNKEQIKKERKQVNFKKRIQKQREDATSHQKKKKKKKQ